MIRLALLYMTIANMLHCFIPVFYTSILKLVIHKYILYDQKYTASIQLDTDYHIRSGGILMAFTPPHQRSEEPQQMQSALNKEICLHPGGLHYCATGKCQ